MLWAAIALSIVLHGVAYLLVAVVFRPPELEIAFELPMDVELGTSESLATVPPASGPAPPQPAPPPRAAPGDAMRDASVPLADAAAPDAQTADDAGPRRERHARDAGTAPHIALRDAGVGAARMPPGAQIAVRVDMARVRESPIADDVRALLAAIPDWRALLDGSGIDPVTQLDRLLIATPNLQREKIVLAGSYHGGEAVVRDAVSRLAGVKGLTATFRNERGIRVAPWENLDPTPRVIALIGPRHFAITRPVDLPRLLAIAAARAQRKVSPGQAAAQPADALLAMEPDEGLSLEVEGAAQFVRGGGKPVPDHVRCSAVARPHDRIALRSVFTYESAEGARGAHDFASALRARYGKNLLVMALGLSDVIEDAALSQVDREVRIELTLTAAQARLVLGYVRELFSPPRTP